MTNIALIIMGVSIIVLAFSNIHLMRRIDVAEAISYYNIKKYDYVGKKLSTLETRIKILSRAIKNSRETNKWNNTDK